MRKSKIIENQKEQINRMTNNICDLERKVEELKHQLEYKEEELLNRYKYAILVDDNFNSVLWNDGRYERQVREIHFSHYPNEIPTIEIHK